MSDNQGGPRARYRDQVRAEVQAHAWSQIAEAGASAVSLKAIATQMGMTAPALYRYFDSRDELLTELILTAYRDLADVFESTAEPRDAPPEQLRQLAAALRHWATTDPQRYLLIYGTPVPGYTAPPEATALAQRIFARVIAACTTLDPGRALDHAMAFWTRLHGVLSLELAGHFVGMDVDASTLYERETRSLLMRP